MAEQERTPSTDGSRDDTGAADHDQPYQFGHKSTSSWPCPFSGMEFARLLIVRGRMRAAKELGTTASSSCAQKGPALVKAAAGLPPRDAGLTSRREDASLP
jgi:hypothetical protein